MNIKLATISVLAAFVFVSRYGHRQSNQLTDDRLSKELSDGSAIYSCLPIQYGTERKLIRTSLAR